MDKNLSSVSDAYKHLVSVYEAKNSDYGNSFEECCNKFGLVSAVVRMNDKINRINSLYDKRDMKVNESLVDTLLDLANYAVMTAVWMNNNDVSHDGVRNSQQDASSKSSPCNAKDLFSNNVFVLNRSISKMCFFLSADLFSSDEAVPLDDFKKACEFMCLNLKVRDIDTALVRARIIYENGKVTRYALYNNYIIISENDDILITQKGRNAIMFDDELVDQEKQFKIFG